MVVFATLYIPALTRRPFWLFSFIDRFIRSLMLLVSFPITAFMLVVAMLLLLIVLLFL
jgi:hypothetical protein